MTETSIPLLSPPDVFGLPGLDKGERARSEVLSAVRAQWPSVEALVREWRGPEAVVAMERLAEEMRARTSNDPEPWREALLLSRQVLYNNMLTVGRWMGCVPAARGSLQQAAQWDPEARKHIEGLLQVARDEEHRILKEENP